MSATNTLTHYGSVAKTLHWLTAALILTLLPLGVAANWWPMDDQQAIATKTLLFSAHKTLGVATFGVALIRILWALSQTRPRLLNAERRFEAGLAGTVHWLLYASLVIVPLSGWLEHSAAEGFAPIWWPLGQNLPLVPKSVFLAGLFYDWHWVFTKVLALALALHVAGAIKHHLIDRDATLARMLRGTPPLTLPAGEPNRRAPPLIAAGLYALAIAGASVPAMAPKVATEAPALAAVASGWQVREGTLAITVRQLGTEVTGQFSDWSAAIEFSETPTDGRNGHVEVVVSTATLTLGSVSAQAIGADFLNAAAHPTATFTANILPAPDGAYTADGTLTIRGMSLPLTLPFTLQTDADTATMQGTATLDRRDFGIGENYTDAGTLGFNVDIAVTLTATRNPD